MKKVLVLGVIVAGFAMTSCKKTFTCECVGVSTGLTPYEKEAKGKDAKDACNEAANKTLGIATEVCTPK